MTNETITLTFPAIPAQVIAELNETETILAASEVEFIRALRARFGSLAKQNGDIKTSWYSIGDQNWSEKESTWLMSDGKHVKGLLAGDFFDDRNTDRNQGVYTGEKLYMVGGPDHKDGWVEITRHGSWSQWQGSPQYWDCGVPYANGRKFGEPDGVDADGNGGQVRWMTDEQIAAEYDVKGIAITLAATLADLATKLPERLTRKRALAESLKTVTAQLLAPRVTA